MKEVEGQAADFVKSIARSSAGALLRMIGILILKLEGLHYREF
jgi:hypothetical protein